MYDTYANIWGILMVNVTIYGILDPMGYMVICISCWTTFSWFLSVPKISVAANLTNSPRNLGSKCCPQTQWRKSSFSLWTSGHVWLLPIFKHLIYIYIYIHTHTFSINKSCHWHIIITMLSSTCLPHGIILPNSAQARIGSLGSLVTRFSGPWRYSWAV